MINLCKKCSHNIGNQCWCHDKPEPLPLGAVFHCDPFTYEQPKVGIWNRNDGYVTCSLCGCNLINRDRQYLYCPDCGAEMMYEVL